LLQVVASDVGGAFPRIQSTPGICGGEPCIVRTRIPVRVLEQYRRLGLSEAALLQNVPTLRARDLANAWAYVQARAVAIACGSHVRRDRAREDRRDFGQIRAGWLTERPLSDLRTARPPSHGAE
jgi:uncharacterized protein (DUF433 family)